MPPPRGSSALVRPLHLSGRGREAPSAVFREEEHARAALPVRVLIAPASCCSSLRSLVRPRSLTRGAVAGRAGGLRCDADSDCARTRTRWRGGHGGLTCARRRRSVATRRRPCPAFMPPVLRRTTAWRYPADPPAVEEIVAVMRAGGDRLHRRRPRGLVVAVARRASHRRSTRAGEHDLDRRRGSLLVRRGPPRRDETIADARVEPISGGACDELAPPREVQPLSPPRDMMSKVAVAIASREPM